MNYKKGFLLAEETLKIIISLIAISFLIYFLVSLYFANQTDEELEQAKATLEHIIEQINDGATEVAVYNPSSSLTVNWFLTSWPHDILQESLLNLIFDDPTKNAIPISCSNKGWDSCLCICSKFGGVLKEEHCDDKGFCLESEFFTKDKKLIEIKDPPLILKINQKDKIISK